MISADASPVMRGITDAHDRLLEADIPLAELQSSCGGDVPGDLAVPELREIVRQSRQKGLRLAREFAAFDGSSYVTGFARIAPYDGDAGSGCEILIENWRSEMARPEEDEMAAEWLDQIDRSASELNARLDAKMRILTAETRGPDLQACVADMKANILSEWTDFVQLIDADFRHPIHWRLLDGVKCKVSGSDRDWRARLLPIGASVSEPDGFELLLVAEQPWIERGDAGSSASNDVVRVGETLTSALRKPISRIIANAQSIKSRLAGPLREEYSDYAGDIVAAGTHLLALMDDLADLDAVESDWFSVASDMIDLTTAAEQSASILGVKAKARNINIVQSSASMAPIAIGELRRVMQILINMLGNAIAYSPEDSTIQIELAAEDQQARISVVDQGAGLTPEQCDKVFAKFERLGREGEGGSGLGLYISRRLARAMNGDLTVISKPGEGSRFTLSLPIGQKNDSASVAQQSRQHQTDNNGH